MQAAAGRGSTKGPGRSQLPGSCFQNLKEGRKREREGAGDPAPAHAQAQDGGRTFPAGIPSSRQDGDADARKPSQHSARMEIPPTHYPAARAASVVESCINYQQGTPHKVFLVQTVKQASLEVSQAEGGGAPASVPSIPSAPCLSAPNSPRHHACFGSHCCRLSKEAGVSGISLVSGGSPGAVYCFHRETHTDSFYGHYYKEMDKCSQFGATSPLSPSETYKNHFQKFLKTGTMFLIYCSSLDQQKLWSCLRFFIA